MIFEIYFPIQKVISIDIQILAKLRYKYGTNWRESGVYWSILLEMHFIFLLTMHCTFKSTFMKLLTILAALTISMLFCFSANSQVIDTTYNKMLLKEINKQNSKISSGMLMGGFCIATGSIISIASNNKKEPNVADYTNLKLYESDYNKFVKSQKTSRTISSIFIGVGGAVVFIT